MEEYATLSLLFSIPAAFHFYVVPHKNQSPLTEFYTKNTIAL